MSSNRIQFIVLRWVIVFALFLACATFGETNELASPHAKVNPVGLGEVNWTRGFWGDRFELCRTQMIPQMGLLMEGTNYSQYFENFRVAAGDVVGRSRGAPFNDGDFYKWMEGASATLAVTNDAQLNQRLDAMIDVIARAQRGDGYLHTPVLIRMRNGDTNAAPFQDRTNFEMYNMGHLLTAACVHHRSTDKTNLLNVARKAADFLYATFLNAAPEVARSSVCPSHYMGMVEFYRETRDSRYLQLAEKFFAFRAEIKEGGDDNQDRVPFEQQTNAMGHAVRANYLYAGAADLFLENGDPKLFAPLEPIWTNVVQQKMYVTGGCGALYDGASPDGSKEQKTITRVHQAYGRNYQLPNITAHNETCANIGNVLWNWRMFLATGEARFMDVAELALYNSVLSGVGLDGTNFFYTNPLRVTERLPTDLRWKRTRVPFMSSFCCPPNVVRTIAEVSTYAYAKSDNAVWVNLYGGSVFESKLGDAGRVKLIQESEYPWNGRVRIRIDQCGAPEFALNLRVPGWATGASIRLNRSPVDVPLLPGTYAKLKRVWKVGDVIDLEFPMPVRVLEANPLVEENLNQVAMQRGPMVYCLESPDLPKGLSVGDVIIPTDAEYVARFDKRLLGGVVVLDGKASSRTRPTWNGQLYRDLKPAILKPIKLQLIPYFAWANRGASEMSVWLPVIQK